MPLSIRRADITRMAVDAIVDPTDEIYSGSGGTDRAIHMAAGRALENDVARLPLLEVGEAVITNAYKLPAKYIIHTHGPIWDGGDRGEAEQLAACYRNCLRIARENGCRSVAFPLISGGTFGFPNDDALRIAKDTISAFLREDEMDVTIVAFHRHTFNLGAKLFADITRFVHENYLELSPEEERPEPDEFKRDELYKPSYSLDPETGPIEYLEETGRERKETVSYSADPMVSPTLEEMLRQSGETFSCMLARLINESGMTPPECYKKARVHKSVYSKIMGNIHYKPAKITAVAFALALELSWKDLKTLLESAGYAMTHTSKFDIVIEYFVRRGDYHIDTINEVLYELDPELPLIGC